MKDEAKSHVVSEAKTNKATRHAVGVSAASLVFAGQKRTWKSQRAINAQSSKEEGEHKNHIQNEQHHEHGIGRTWCTLVDEAWFVLVQTGLSILCSASNAQMVSVELPSLVGQTICVLLTWSATRTTTWTCMDCFAVIWLQI